MIASPPIDGVADLFTSRSRLLAAAAVSMMLAIASLSFSAGSCFAEDPEVEKLKLKLERRRQELAEKEREKVQEQQRQLQRIVQARRWALRQFEAGERGIIPRPKRVLRLLEQTQHRRDAVKFSLLQYRDRARGGISRGTALNFFLQECGATAFDHEFYRELTAPERARDNDRPFEMEVLKGIAAEYRLSEDIIRHIRYVRGLTGPALTGRINEEPLDLEWPSPLREVRFQRRCQQIEKLREQALTELREGRPISAATADQLITEVQKLLDQVRAEMQTLLQQVREERSGAHREWHRFAAAERHVLLLVAGTYRLIEARHPEDVLIGEFHGERTIQELLAWMYRNNLRFAAADANGESAYHLIFEMMTRYYVDLYTLSVALAEDERELRASKELEGRLRETALGNTLSALKQFELDMKRLENWGQAIDAIGDVLGPERRQQVIIIRPAIPGQPFVP